MVYSFNRLGTYMGWNFMVVTMEQIKKNLPWLLAMAFLVVIFILLFRTCGNNPDSHIVVIHDTIPGDPLPIEKPVYIPKPVYIDTGSIKWLSGEPIPTDTSEILKDYFATRFYSDTLNNDSSMLAVVNDSIRANRIVSRKFTYQNRRATAINTTIIQPPKKESLIKVYGGAFAGYSVKSNRVIVGPELTLALRQGFIGRYGYDIAGNGHVVSAGWKISFKKN